MLKESWEISTVVLSPDLRHLTFWLEEVSGVLN